MSFLDRGGADEKIKTKPKRQNSIQERNETCAFEKIIFFWPPSVHSSQRRRSSKDTGRPGITVTSKIGQMLAVWQVKRTGVVLHLNTVLGEHIPPKILLTNPRVCQGLGFNRTFPTAECFRVSVSRSKGWCHLFRRKFFGTKLLGKVPKEGSLVRFPSKIFKQSSQERFPIEVRSCCQNSWLQRTEPMA